jgi:GntR family transcriptional repressor for pyruvate dehydrogenase complex
MAISKARSLRDSAATRRRGIRSQERLVSLIEAGKASAAEAHWRTYMTIVGRVLLAQRAHTVIDLMHHD